MLYQYFPYSVYIPHAFLFQSADLQFSVTSLEYLKEQTLILVALYLQENKIRAISHFANEASTQHKNASESQQKLFHIPNTIGAFTKQNCVKIQFYFFSSKSIIFMI